MMKKTFLTLMVLAVCLLTQAAQPDSAALVAKQARQSALRSHLRQHYKIYGFVRNYFAYDSRECIDGTGDLYMYMPKDHAWNRPEDATGVYDVPREDLNALNSFRFLSLTTRVGLDITGYRWRGTEFGGKIEADFYAGLNKREGENHALTGTAQLRLRQAYMTVAWDSLHMGKDLARVQLLMGQAWHPMAADLCDAIALNSGAPFGPFSRTPQVKMDARLGHWITLTGAALWQMQYVSMGPDGASAEYIAYSMTPEAYLGVSLHHKGLLIRAGADVLSICPRHIGEVTDPAGQKRQVRVSDRITTASPFLYLQYKTAHFSVKAKTIFAEAGEHLNLNGGYGVRAVKADGSWDYTPTRNSSTWVSLIYGGELGNKSRLEGILVGGYVRNFGTKDPLVDADNDGQLDLYFSKNSFDNMNRMWRLSPTLLWTVGKFQLGCEYEITSVQYGDKSLARNAANALYDQGLHWVTNHRVQLMTKYNF